MDEAISETLSDYIKGDHRILELIESNDPQYEEIIDAKLRSDLSINKLSQSSSLNPPASLTNRPPGFRTGFSDVIAGLSKSVINNHLSELKQLVNNPQPTQTASAIDTPTRQTSSPDNQISQFQPNSELQNQSYDNLIASETSSVGSILKNSNLELYSQLTPEQKQLFNQILPQRIAQASKANPGLHNSLKSGDDQRIQEALSQIAIHADVRQSKSLDPPNIRQSLSSLDQLEKDIFSRLLAGSMSSIMANKGDEIDYLIKRDGIPKSTTSSQEVAVNSRNDGSLNNTNVVPTTINLENRRRASITEDDYQFYYNLDTDKRNMIDKVVALRIVNEHAVKEGHNLKSDKEYLNNLPQKERRSIKRLAQFLDGNQMNDIKVNIVQEDLNYYDNVSNQKKDDINRLIVGDIFNFTDEHNIYGVRGEDQRILSTFNHEKKSFSIYCIIFDHRHIMYLVVV